jgi:hypothetical protein
MLLRPKLALLLLAFSTLALPAQEKGQWRALSNTARSITGDIYFTGSKLAINFTPYTIAQIRELEPVEAAALFSPEMPAASGGVGNLYRLDIPADKRFLHRNTLCGSEPTQWAITWVTGKSLELAFFTGPSIPTLTAEAIGSSTRLCGTFNYTR